MIKLHPALLNIGQPLSFRKGEHIFSAEDKAGGFYYVKCGEVRVFKMDAQGKEVEVVRLGPGGFLGEAVVFVSSVYPVYAQAVTDADTLYFATEDVQRKIKEEASVARFFIDLLAQKCVTLSSRIEALELQTVRQRLAQYLLSRCSREHDCMVELRTTKTELAKILGTIGETLSRNLKQMQDEGLIEVKGQNIFVKNCAKLREEIICQPPF